MKNKYYEISVTDFHFVPEGYGHFRVKFTSRHTRYCWVALVDDMRLIDATYQAETPKRADLVRLKEYIKKYGRKFDPSGKRIW